MLLPYNVDVPMIRLPIANWALIAVTSIVSLTILFGLWPVSDKRSEVELENAWRKLTDKNASPKDINDALRTVQRHDEQSAPALALRPGAFSLPQLGSHLLVHGDLVHLLGNMFFLFVFGNAVNAKLGHVLYLVSYILLGAIGGLTWLLIGDGRWLVGASGAIMGIVGVFFVLFPRNDVRVFYLWLGGGGAFSIASVWLILFYLGSDLAGALIDGGGPIAYVVHLGGGFAGIAATIGVAACGWLEPTAYEENLLQTLGLREKKTRAQSELGTAKHRSKPSQR